MRKKLQLVATLTLLAFSIKGYSQRYLNEVFTSVTVTSDVIYGNNISILTGTPVASNLKMDVYEPVGDVLAARPLVIVLHTGSFLPKVYNGQPTGSKNDSAVVEMCTKFAKRGYVAVAADYRLGWNATSTSQDVRTGTLLNAVYRAIQDAKNCVRYFKEDKATTNTYKIDTTKIAVGGLGSGGYISLAYASLNQVSEITMAKFIDFSLTTPAPYINQALSGNFDGTNTTPLNTANYPNHTSTINMAYNIGGAIGDTSWINQGEIPIAGMHCTKDPNAPYKTGVVIVPSTGQTVVVASGSYDVERIINKPSINNNAIFNNSVYTDVYSTRANLINDGYEGLYPFITPTPGSPVCGGAVGPQTEQGSPWDWWDGATFAAQYNAVTGTTNGAGANCLQMSGNPDMSAAKGRLYIDTIQGFLNPRIVCALGLAGCVANGIHENENNSAVDIYPNPSNSNFTISLTGYNTIQRIELFDITGRLVKDIAGLNTQTYSFNSSDLQAGIYFSKIILNNKKEITKKVILK